MEENKPKRKYTKRNTTATKEEAKNETKIWNIYTNK